MADPQPEETRPAAGVPDQTRVDDGSEPSTVDAPARWSGSAAVPEPEPRKPWWRRDRAEPEEPTPADLWATTPPVDPWAGQDTPWDAFPVVLDETPPPMPPTRVEPPAPSPPPVNAPLPPPVNKPVNSLPQPANASKPAGNPKLSRKERRRARNAPPPPVNRLPLQTRPPTGPPGPAPGLPPGPPSGPIVRGRPLPAPPPWAPRQAARPMPPPPRRKRRWGRRMALLTLLGVVCCCGAPYAWMQLPTARQYPVTAALPSSFSDLQLRDTEDGGQNGFAGVYRDGRGKKVTVFGETGFRLTPGSDVRAHLEQSAAEYDLTDIQSFDLGESGAHESCGVGRDGGAAVVVCAWADHGSLATVLLTRRSITDSAELVARLRDEVLSPG